MSGSVILTVDGPTARMTIDRPERLNSLDESAMVELAAALDEVAASPAVRVLVLTGAGRAFCAGQDLADPAMHGADGDPPDIGGIVERHFKPVVLRLRELPVPTVAAVNGLAAGGGAALALACDIVIAAESAYFLQAFSKIGLTPDTGSTWHLARTVGVARAIGLTYLADKLPAVTAAERGLIWQAVPDEDFDERVAELAGRLAESPTKALVATRHLIDTAADHTLDEQLSREALAIQEMGRSVDYAEGLAAFTAKRSPRFTGA